ncbi:MAG: hypothetical protein NZL94_00805 [Meiothermus sp.]|nr:hypothetical protein [Meiothermus sp.]MCS7057410.1 hypothetical protein [Meiothermus sp.]
MRSLVALLTTAFLGLSGLAHPFQGGGGYVEGQVDFEPNDAPPGQEYPR